VNTIEGTALERFKNARRSTRLSRQIPVVITSLDPEQTFSGKFKTVVINAHGCGIILPVQLKNKTPVSVELISNGRSRMARIVLVLSVIEGASWLVGLEFDSPAGKFWEIENPPADWEV
jgi:hypothetical protein